MGRQPVDLLQHEHLPGHRPVLRPAERREETHRLLLLRPRCLLDVSSETVSQLETWRDEAVEPLASHRFQA